MNGPTPIEITAAADGGRRAELAQGAEDLSRWLKTHPVPALSGSTAILVPIICGTEADRITAVDAFAREQHVTARWNHGSYEAVKAFGPIRYTVYCTSDKTVKDLVDRLRSVTTPAEAPAETGEAA